MKRILFIHSSLSGDDSASTQVAQSLVERLVEENPGSEVSRIDLSEEALPHLGADEFNSWSTPEVKRDAHQVRLAGRSDALIGQLLSHDTLVLAVPMYNLGIPSTLKAWIDRVSRAGKTFRYTPKGPEGMITDMRAYLVFARGGIYRDTPLDTQTAYLNSVLGLMGIDAVEAIFAEGLNMGGDSREKSIASALARVNDLVTGHLREASHAAA